MTAPSSPSFPGRAAPDAAAMLIGRHPSMDELRRCIERVARSPSRVVLVYGETGTGKSIVAHLLHALSARSERAFVELNCAAIPGNLLESELFGHERGAFTGAVGRKVGLLEAGHTGTVLLDEIREMSLELQAKLLTLLDNQRFRRIGAVSTIEVDVRFVATSNRILLSEVRDGRFREDLYYRLQVVPINIPPLRERGDDVFVLTEHYLRELNERYAPYGRRVLGLDAEAAKVFEAYRWPGNVRELQNLLERIFILESEPRIGLGQLPPRILSEVAIGRRIAPRQPWATGVSIDGRPDTPPADFWAATDRHQRKLIGDALARSGGRLGAAACALGLSRHALRHQMARLEMRMA